MVKKEGRERRERRGEGEGRRMGGQEDRRGPSFWFYSIKR